MEITINTRSYNERRYGRPWIAKVDFSTPKGEFSWGEWTGDHHNGGEGTLSINANPGDIIAYGQKDNRQPKNSAPDFYVVLENGEKESIGDKGSAYKYYLAHKPTAPIVPENPLAKTSDADIIAEFIRRGLDIQKAA